MVWRSVQILVLLFTKVTSDVQPSLSQVSPNLNHQYDYMLNDTIENQEYFRFTTVSIFQRKYFPHDDPNLLAMLRKHLENPKNRRKPVARIANAFEKDQKKYREILEKDHVKGLNTKIWSTLIPTAYKNTPIWFLKKTSDKTIFCHLCLLSFPDKVRFDKHYMRHFTNDGSSTNLKKTRRRTTTFFSPGMNVTYKTRRRALRTKTTARGYK